jgi:hypothetical protein
MLRLEEERAEANQPRKDVYWGETFRGWLPVKIPPGSASATMQKERDRSDLLPTVQGGGKRRV